MNSLADIPHHRLVTHAVHKHGAKILLQILHSGRYGYQPLVVSASPVKSPISLFKPREMSERNILTTIKDYAHAASLSKRRAMMGLKLWARKGIC